MSTHAAVGEPIIFVVDDDPTANRAVADLVRSFGHRAEAFSSPKEFLTRLDDLTAADVGCVVFDLRMPSMDGLELHERILERNLSLPAICVTGYAETAATVKAMRNGVVAVLDKPFRENELWSFIQEALARSEEERRRHSYRQALQKRLELLSPQDRQVLQLILEGCKNRTMSRRLGVSLRTVENRRKRVFDVMQAESVAQLTRQVIEYEYKLLPAAVGNETWLALPFEPVG